MPNDIFVVDDAEGPKEEKEGDRSVDSGDGCIEETAEMGAFLG